MSYNKGITAPARFETLSHVAQDQTFEVRESFLKKVVTYLRHNRMMRGVAARLNMVLFLVAHEPEDDLKEHILLFARSRRRLPDSERNALLGALKVYSFQHLLSLQGTAKCSGSCPSFGCFTSWPTIPISTLTATTSIPTSSRWAQSESCRRV